MEGEDSVAIDGATFVWEGRRIAPKDGASGDLDGDGEGEEEEKVLSEEEWEVLLLQSQLKDAEEQVRRASREKRGFPDWQSGPHHSSLRSYCCFSQVSSINQLSILVPRLAHHSFPASLVPD